MNGRLRLRFDAASGDRPTSVTVLEQEPPLKVVRAFPTGEGGALVHLQNLSGGVLGGDTLENHFEVGQRAYAQITTTGATRLYKSRCGAEDAVQRTRVHVAAGGLLEYLPDPLIPFAETRYRQETRIDLEHGAGLFWWETVAPGREGHGEVFRYDRLDLRLDIFAEGRSIVLDRAVLEPLHRPLCSPVRLGPYRYFTALYICRVGEPAGTWEALEAGLRPLTEAWTCPGESEWGVSALHAHGVVVRGVARRGSALAGALMECWRVAKQTLYGVAGVPPRKIY